MLPSSVLATPFERTGAVLDAASLAPFYQEPEVNGLAEVMDFSAVAQQQPDMLQK
ncbi:Adenine deaminase [Weissella viridescens]|nr:Adenine deaminase [Weissella viridescens]